MGVAVGIEDDSPGSKSFSETLAFRSF